MASATDFSVEEPNNNPTFTANRKRAFMFNEPMIVIDRAYIRSKEAAVNNVCLISHVPISADELKDSPSKNLSFISTPLKCSPSEGSPTEGSMLADDQQSSIVRSLQKDVEKLVKLTAERRAKIKDRDAELAELGTKIKDRDAELAELEAKINDWDAERAELGAKINDRDAELADLKKQIIEQNALADLYGVNFTSPYLCVASLIKYMEQFVLQVASEVVKEFLSCHSFTSKENSSLLITTQATTFQKFLIHIDNLGSDAMKKDLLSAVQQKFLVENGHANNDYGFDLLTTFQEFTDFWEKRNMDMAHVFDWNLNKSGVINQRKKEHARLQAKILEDLEARVSRVGEKHLSDSPHFYLKPFKDILKIAIEKKKGEICGILGSDS